MSDPTPILDIHVDKEAMLEEIRQQKLQEEAYEQATQQAMD